MPEIIQSSDDKKLGKIEYIRIIGLWLAIMALVIFSYQLGQWNALNIINEIHNYCPSYINYSVNTFGDTTLWQNLSASIIP